MESTQESFGQIHFGNAELGDSRRTRRLIQLADTFCSNPGGSVPEMLAREADREAFYRLCDAEEVTHESVLASHRAFVLKELQSTRKFLLVVHDATELDFTSRTSLRKLGQIGNGRGRGYVVQNSLVVDPQAGEVIGLANQILHTRHKVAANEGVADKRARQSRESRLWIQGTHGLPSRRQIVDVCDRGADTFEFLEHACQSGRTFVVRSSHNRQISLGHSAKIRQCVSLHSHLRSLSALTTTKTTVRISPEHLDQRREDWRQGKRKAVTSHRVAQLSISAAPVRVHSPHVRRGQHGRELLVMWAVRIWEPNPPRGCEPLEWILLTNHPIQTAADAKLVVTWYEGRWIIEEFHKGQKTGCGIEKLQFRDEERLQPAIALLSIVAISLLQLREAARRPDATTRLANTLVEPDSIHVLSMWETGKSQPEWSIHEYYTALAKLGGYRPRKGCPPGWQTLWRGHSKLTHMLDGYRITREKSPRSANRTIKKSAKR